MCVRTNINLHPLHLGAHFVEDLQPPICCVFFYVLNIWVL